MKTIKKVSYILVLVGALNWGLIGLLGLNLVELLVGDMPALERLIYALVGLSALVVIFKNKKCANCHACSSCNTCDSCGDTSKSSAEAK